MWPPERAESPATLGEFLCAALLLAGVVAALWLAARPWEEPEDPCLRFGEATSSNEAAGTLLRHREHGRAFEALGWEVTSLDLEGEPTIKCDILDWDYTAFPPGHFQVVWASRSAASSPRP